MLQRCRGGLMLMLTREPEKGGSILVGCVDGWGEMPSEAHLEHVVTAHGRPRHTHLCFLQGIVPW